MLRNRFQVCKPQPLCARVPKLARKITFQRTFANLSTKINNNNDSNKYDYPSLPTAYDHSTNTMYWQSRPVTVVGRTMQILFHVAGFLVRTGLRINRGGDDAVDLRLMLTGLGPAFVKIGQAVSARPDILSPKYLKELERLQDRLPAFPDDQAFQVFKDEMGQGINGVFSEMSSGPIAAASLGQVYKAILKTSGEQIALKVQRPGVLEQISLDIFILRYFATQFRKWGRVNTDLPAAMDEWATNLFREMDYRQEAQHAIEFRDLYMIRLPQIYVPQIHTDLTTKKILVMEWIEGNRLDGDLGLVEVGVQCSLEQIMGEGFYHADPHPGNLLKTLDGRLAYLDFGMMGRLTLSMRHSLIRAPIHLINGEVEPLVQDLIVLGFLPKGTDVSQLVPALTNLFTEALKDGVSNLSFGQLALNLGQTLYKFKFRLPSYYTLLIRSLTVLEGIALAADPNYKVLVAAYPWLARRVLFDKSPQLQQTLKGLLYKENKFQFSRLSGLLEQAVRPPGRMNRDSLQQETTQVVKQQPKGQALLLLLSEEGAFLRGILEDELAKGLDAAWRISFDQTVAQLVSNRSQNVFVRTMLSFPTLSDQNDVAQVQGIALLSQQMRSLASEGYVLQGNGNDQQNSQSRHSMHEGSLILQWLVSELRELPASARQQVIRLPISIIQKFSSRVAARALRSWITRGRLV